MEWGCGMTYDMTWYGMGTCRKGNAWPAMAFFLSSISAPEAQEPVGLHGLGWFGIAWGDARYGEVVLGPFMGCSGCVCLR
jgi:hypothetical protein